MKKYALENPTSVSSSKSLFLNTLFYAILQVVTIGVGIILPKLILNVYGSEINGIVSTINSFISYFNFLEAGLGLALMYSLFKPLTEKNNDKVSEIVSYSKHSYWKISATYFILVIFLCVFFAFSKTQTSLEKYELIGLTFVIGITGTLDFFVLSKYRILLTADRKEYIISIAISISLLVRFLSTILLLKIPNISITIVKLIPIFTIGIHTLILYLYVKKKYPHINFNAKYDVKTIETSKRWDALFLQICISSNIPFATILISQMVSYEEASVFAVYNLIVSSMVALSQMFNQGITPIFGKVIADKRNINKANKLYENFEIFIISLIFSITFIMLGPFLSLYTKNITDINYVNQNFSLLFCIWAMLFIYRRSSTALINSSGIYRQLRKNNIINLILFIILSLILVIFLKTIGILIALIIVAIHRDIYFILITRKQILFEKPLLAFLNMLSVFILFGICILPFLTIIKIQPANWSLWILNAIIVSLWCFLVCSLFMFIFKRSTTIYIIKLVCKKLKIILKIK